jgi:hypothetical protein
MPIRLTISETTLSGHDYDDILGVRYEFPTRYRALVSRGERLVYYRGRRQADGGTQPQVYLGTGIVGAIEASRGDPTRLVCQIDDWSPFPEPLYFKDGSGNYYEEVGAQGGFYWQVGVRHLDDAVYERIVRAATAAESPSPGTVTQEEKSAPSAPTVYASPELRKAVDEYAITAALAELSRVWPTEEIALQPHNNPGFDVRVGPSAAPVRYVEVKGTTLPLPQFFLSEGERAFSEREARQYTLLVVYGINLHQASHKLFSHQGAVSDDAFAFSPRQWACSARRSDA